LPQKNQKCKAAANAFFAAQTLSCKLTEPQTPVHCRHYITLAVAMN